MSLRRVRWALFLVGLASYMGLQWYLWTALLPGANGEFPFDIRAFGYSVETAGTYLAALTDDARAVLAGPVRWLDTVFPICFAAWLALISWARGSRFIARAGAVLAVFYGIADLAENAAIQDLLAGPVPPMAELVERASLLTTTKYKLLVGAVALIIFGRLSR